MSRKFSRRKFMAGTAAGAALATFKFPAPALAQAAPFKLGLLTVKTGPLAQGGIQMEQGVVTYLKEKNYTFAGRKVEFISADTGGNPAGTKTKAQELIEREKVDAILGPLAAFELLAITDYIAEQKTPMLSLAGAEDMTQRRPNPYFLRPSATSSQAMHPMADFAAKELKLKRIVTISEDFAFGHEQMGGFQQTFEEAGGKIVNKIWPPLVTPDYTPFVAQIGDCDGVCQGFAGSNPLRFLKNLRRGRAEIPGRHRRNRRRRCAAAQLRRRGARHVQLLPLHARPQHRRQQAFRRGDAEGLRRRPGLLRRGTLRRYPNRRGGPGEDQRQIRRQGRLHQGAALGRAEGHAARRDQVRSLRQCGWRLLHPPPRKGERQIVNKTVKTYHNVSQFWTYDEKKFLAAAGLFAQLPAAEVITTAMPRAPHRRPRFVIESAGTLRL